MFSAIIVVLLNLFLAALHFLVVALLLELLLPGFLKNLGVRWIGYKACAS